MTASPATLASTSYSWTVPEYRVYERTSRWYLIFGILCLALIIFALVTDNFLFAIIILLFSFIVIVREFFPPEQLSITIDARGVTVGPHEYPYKEIKTFAVIYEPPHSKYLYLHPKGISPSIVSINLGEQNPLSLREYLLHFVPEDMEKDTEDLNDVLSRLLKI